ncbi:MAG: ATP-binding cassette domain-containing protein, partial [Candidatus Methylomirabilales bacterium]
MIQVTDLEFRYREGEFCLRIPELSVERGETAAMIGPSGSGKTTLLHLMAGIAVPLSGRVVTNNVEVTQLNDGARRDFRISNIGL